MKSRLALLAVPFLALACSDTGQPEALTNPPAPSFTMSLLPNMCDVSAGVIQRKGGMEVVGTDGGDHIDCSGYVAPGGGRKG